MGWFDKKSWKLRRKIRDLQSELAVAEREGKYVVEQGLFFAELREMADATLMVFGTADHLDAEEETVIRNFFDRNGFGVDLLRLDKAQKTLAAVEIIPPEELTRRVARVLKEAGYRLIDDSEKERPSDLENRTLSLSSIIRVISALFASHVHHLIISTPIKLNMEGNRLLHWMPLIRDTLMTKVSPEIAAVCRQPFIEAYNHYYGQFGTMAQPEALDSFSNAPADNEDFIFDEQGVSKPHDVPTQSGSAEIFGNGIDASDLETESKNVSVSQVTASTSKRAEEAAYVLAQIYKGLIGASDQRRVTNAELVLDKISRFFSAQSVCLIVRIYNSADFSLQANSGDSLCMDASQKGFIACETDSLQKAVASRSVTVLPPSLDDKSNPHAVIVPISAEANRETILYVLEPRGFSKEEDSAHLTLFSRVFNEFPDLLIATQQK